MMNVENVELQECQDDEMILEILYRIESNRNRIS